MCLYVVDDPHFISQFCKGWIMQITTSKKTYITVESNTILCSYN